MDNLIQGIIIVIISAGAGWITALSMLASQRKKTKDEAVAAVDIRWKILCDEQQERLDQMAKRIVDLQDRISQQEKQISELWTRLHQSEMAGSVKDTKIVALEAAGVAKDLRIAALESKVGELQERIRVLEAENTVLRGE